jgi:hypothetical protein
MLYHSDKQAVISMWKRPRSSASQPPAPMPAMVSKTSQGRGFLCGTPLALAIVSSNLSKIRRVEIACSPPPSRVKIFSGLGGVAVIGAMEKRDGRVAGSPIRQRVKRAGDQRALKKEHRKEHRKITQT